jgi:phosphate transport system protein
MAAIAQLMVRDSLDAFMRNDPALAEDVIARDDEVDRLNHQIHRQLLGYMTEAPQSITRATRVLFAAKYLEKIADHETSIAEMVIFMVKGYHPAYGQESENPCRKKRIKHRRMSQ